MYNIRKGVRNLKYLMIFLLTLAMLFSVGCFMDPEPDPEDPIVEEEEPVVVNKEIHNIQIEADGTLPVLVGESIILTVHAYNWPEMEEVRLDTSDIITWAENCNRDVLDPLVGLSTTFTAEEVGKYQISACYEWPEVEECPFPQYLCTGITIHVVEE